jgi:hypothetical protein
MLLVVLYFGAGEATIDKYSGLVVREFDLVNYRVHVA